MKSPAIRATASDPSALPRSLADSILRLAQHQSATEMDLMIGFEELIRPHLGVEITVSRYSQATRLGGIKPLPKFGVFNVLARCRPANWNTISD